MEQQTDGRLGSWFKCFWRGYHDPKRHPLGGFRCRDCRISGTDMESMGFEAGHVSLLRRVFSRGNAGFTRTHSWEPGPGGY